MTCLNITAENLFLNGKNKREVNQAKDHVRISRYRNDKQELENCSYY